MHQTDGTSCAVTITVRETEAKTLTFIGLKSRFLLIMADQIMSDIQNHACMVQESSIKHVIYSLYKEATLLTDDSGNSIL